MQKEVFFPACFLELEAFHQQQPDYFPLYQNTLCAVAMKQNTGKLTHMLPSASWKKKPNIKSRARACLVFGTRTLWALISVRVHYLCDSFSVRADYFPLASVQLIWNSALTMMSFARAGVNFQTTAAEESSIHSPLHSFSSWAISVEIVSGRRES